MSNVIPTKCETVSADDVCNVRSIELSTAANCKPINTVRDGLKRMYGNLTKFICPEIDSSLQSWQYCQPCIISTSHCLANTLQLEVKQPAAAAATSCFLADPYTGCLLSSP